MNRLGMIKLFQALLENVDLELAKTHNSSLLEERQLYLEFLKELGDA